MYRKYDRIFDSGHSWLEVDLQEIKDLKLENEISSYSYISVSNKVYLEEDCDLWKFFDAKKLTKDDINSIYYDNECFVREMNHYQI